MLFNLFDIQAIFTAETLNLGKKWLDSEYVSRLRVIKSGEIVTAEISVPNPCDLQVILSHRVFIRTYKKTTRVKIEGECTCDNGVNCAHIATALLKSLLDVNLLSKQFYNPISKQPDNKPIDHINEQTGSDLSKPNIVPEDTVAYTSQKLVYLLVEQDKKITLCVKPCVLGNKNSANRQHKVDDLNYFDPAFVERKNLPRFLQTNDIVILKKLNELNRDKHSDFPLLLQSTSSDLLRDLISTKQCYFVKNEQIDLAEPLTIGEIKLLDLKWPVNQQGVQNMSWQCAGNENPFELIHLSHLWYFDKVSHQCGGLKVENRQGIRLSEALIQAYFNKIQIKPEELTCIRQWRKKYSECHETGPRDFEIISLPKSTPTPILVLTSVNPSLTNGDTSEAGFLQFDYNGVIAMRDHSKYHYDGQRLYQIDRDRFLEDKFSDQLIALGLSAIKNKGENTLDDACIGNNGYRPSKKSDNLLKWSDFQLESLPVLRAKGWRIKIDTTFRLLTVESDQWHCVLEENPKQDWFDVNIGVEIDGENIDLIPALIELIASYPHGFPEDTVCQKYFVLPIGENRFIRIAADRLRKLFNLLLEFVNSATLKQKDKISLSRYQMAHFSGMEKNESFLKIQAKKSTLELIEQLKNIDHVSPVKIPCGLKADLRPYQKSGLNWLQFLRINRLAGILADDMGLGKTIQTLAHILLEKEQGRLLTPALIIVPTSLIFNWIQEIEKFTPQLSCLKLHGPNRHDLFDSIVRYDVVLTTYSLLRRDLDRLILTEYHLLILDEAQNIKNSDARSSVAVRQVNAKHRLCITGTPMENHLGELWSLYHFLIPGLFGSYDRFQKQWRTPIEKKYNALKAEKLAALVRPFLLRRTKELVAPELPSKTEITLKVVLEGSQREFYESIRLAMHDHVKKEIRRLGIGKSQLVIMNALLKLRQICCDPLLLSTGVDDKPYNGGSAKLELLMDLLTEMVAEGRRILVFSQFTSMLRLIEFKLNQAHLAYVTLTGKTLDRESVISQFQNQEIPIFLISLKAGGVGLNLTKADTVIHYDPWWNPAVEQQATARAHRIGQKNPVFVYKLICQDSVEEKIQNMQQYKQSIAGALYDEKGGSDAKWCQSQIDVLFAEQTVSNGNMPMNKNEDIEKNDFNIQKSASEN